ncbi:MAG: response regulator transcription factor [Nitrospira sp.]
MKQSNSAKQRHTVLIASRELPIRIGLLTILANEAGLFMPPPAATVSELTTMASKHRTALIVMDVQFPDSDGDGIDACRRLLSQHPTLRVLFFASEATPQLIMRAVDAGAAGFLLKAASQTELLTGIRQLLAGQSVFDPTLMSQTLKWMREQEHSNEIPLPRLSPRHQQILPLLSEGLTNKEISFTLNLSEKTVKNYLADLFDRLQMSRRAQVAAWFISHSVRQLPSHDTSIAAEQIWGTTRTRALSQEEPTHAHHSSY